MSIFINVWAAWSTLLRNYDGSFAASCGFSGVNGGSCSCITFDKTIQSPPLMSCTAHATTSLSHEISGARVAAYSPSVERCIISWRPVVPTIETLCCRIVRIIYTRTFHNDALSCRCEWTLSVNWNLAHSARFKIRCAMKNNTGRGTHILQHITLEKIVSILIT